MGKKKKSKEPVAPTLGFQMDPAKILFSIGAAAAAYLAVNMDRKVDTALEGINGLTVVSERLLMLQEGDTTELEKRGRWMNEMNQFRSKSEVHHKELEIRVERIESLQAKHYSEHRQ